MHVLHQNSRNRSTERGRAGSRVRSILRWATAPALLALFAWTVGGSAPRAYGQAATATPTPIQRPGGVFEDNDPTLLYAGTWTSVADSRASGGALRRSDTTDASVELTFPGPNVRWITAKGPDRGLARVFVDGQDTGTVDLYAPSEQFQQEVTRGGLDGETSHTIRIVVTGQRNGASTGTKVDIDALIVAGAEAPVPLRFEDTDPSVTYSGSWATAAVAAASGGAVHRANEAAAAAQLAFSGTSVTWVTSRGPNRGIARVLIDGTAVATADLYAATESYQQEITQQGLADAAHTIRIEVTGTHSGASTDNGVDVDAFVVFGAPATPVPTLTPTATVAATSTPAPAATPAASPPAATATSGPVPPAPPAPHDERYFAATSFRIDHAPFWDYFNSMGAIDTFGYPISRTFMFLGCSTQIFQRQLMQQCGTDAPVQTMNLLDPDLMPYNQINFSTFPAYEGDLAGQAPGPETPSYGTAVLNFFRTNAPNTFQGMPVNYYNTFVSTVPGSDPQSDPNFAALINLQIWGFPTSHPAPDPSNGGFVYQRFQRGIMHFDASTGVTRGILLAQYFEGIIVGQPGPSLPPDLMQEAQGSRFFHQYCPGGPNWVCRPNELPATDMTFAFEPE